MALPAVGSLPPIRLDRSLEKIKELAKPQTRWQQLSIASNDQTFRIFRIFGRFCYGLTLVFVLLLVHSVWTLPLLCTTTKVYALLMLVSGVSRNIFRYFGDTSDILKSRGEVERDFEEYTLANIRSIYPNQNIISDQELNEWARYFLHTQTFDIFFNKQWSTIFDYEFEPATKKLIKEKFLYRIFYPDDPKNLSLYDDVLKSKLFEDKSELKAIRTLQEKIRNLKISSLAEACKRYEEFKKEYQEKDPSFSTLPPDQRPLYAWLFSLFFFSKNLGIKALEEQYPHEMKKFFPPEDPSSENQQVPHFQQPYIQGYLADRDAEAGMSYQEFIDRNKKKSLLYVTNLPRFLSLVLQANLGLILTEQKFKVRIAYFSAEIQVRELVLEQEWKNIKTYEETRKRNGEEAIKKVDDSEVKKRLAKKFLELPPQELAEIQAGSPSKYEDERKALDIDQTAIDTRLSQTWGNMSFKAILELRDSVAQKRILAFAKKKSGKQKAIHEIEQYSVDIILEFFQPLFDDDETKRVLGFADFNFVTRLDRLQPAEAVGLIQRHGAFIKRTGWFEMKSLPLIKAVHSFLKHEKTVFLYEKPLPSTGVWHWLTTCNLISSDLDELRNRTIQQLAKEEQNHRQIIDSIEAAYEAEKEQIPKRVSQQQSELEKARRERKEELDAAERILAEKEKAKKEFYEEKGRLEQEIKEKKRLLTEKRALLEEKQKKKTQLDGMPKTLSQIDKNYQEELRKIRDLETKIKEENKEDPAVKALESAKEILKTRYEQLKTEKEGLVATHDKIVVELQALTSGQASKVTPQEDKRVKAASAPKTAPVQDRTPKIEQLTSLDSEIDEKARLMKECQTKIEEKDAAITKIIEDFAQDKRYKSAEAARDDFAKKYRDSEALQKQLEKDCSDLEALQAQILQIGTECRRLKQTLEAHMKNEYEIGKRQPHEAKVAHDAIFKLYQEVDQKLTEVKTNLLSQLNTEAKAKYEGEKKKETERHQTAVEGYRGIKPLAEKRLEELCV